MNQRTEAGVCFSECSPGKHSFLHAHHAHVCTLPLPCESSGLFLWRIAQVSTQSLAISSVLIQLQ